MFSSSEVAQFRRICSSFGVNLSKGMIEKFEAYTSLLLEWNRRMHLVSKGDAKSDRILRHVIDSLCIFRILDVPRDTNLLDIGSGAGFPAIPVKIVRRDVKMTLIESTHKKTLFLEKLTEVLKLEETVIINQRAEKIVDHTEFRERFDLVTAKALGRLEDIVRLGMPFLKTGGFLVAYKGKDVEGEIEQIDSSDRYRIKDVAKIEIPEFDISRYLVVMEKTG
jgi:16S rRNA (guanine527-N7)-methyltransferase